MSEIWQEFLMLDNILSITLYCIVVFFIAWIFSRIIRSVAVQVLKKKQKDKFGKTSLQFFKNSVKFFLGLFAIFYLIFTVPVFRSKAAIIFSGAGILAAIIGFAAQAALSNLIAGAFIVIFKPFRVGDYIKLDDARIGIVEDITLRHTVINNFENKRLIIPNSVISTDSILNHTIDDSYILSFNNFKIGLKANVDLAKKIIQEEAIKLESVIDNRTAEQVLERSIQPVEVRFIDTFENHIHLRAYVWLNDPFQEFKMKCELKEAVHKRFISENVDLPIPLLRLVKEEN
ncbi:hypothetical protein LPB136_03115 [Tenacibaculum todarodis]|uniref:Mechanosensitive ion channel MscS domain-containing protein n=1 Tax=Tenacibaculum todarodis TaxID=1850252 RepID=A0A1L3JGZ6_9FLAO|nr:mechanosensitive ion channel family protein [Tenacibaculum todarodis]APG64415.1 hypothetical protein LPB136_03115 [Tenacibaculum todarodis]